jgi:cysteine-rich repeat protein
MANGASAGGGLYLYVSSPTIANTIVAFNSSGIRLDGGAPTPLYNCVYGNIAYDYEGLTDPTGIDGNISADPVFVQNPEPGPDGMWGTGDDDLGDLQLSSSSPCIDAGDNDEVPPDTPDLDDDWDKTEPLPYDLAGGPRFLDNPTSPDTGTPGVTGLPVVDIGAYENAVWCGNGVIEMDEECDDGRESATCDADCTFPECGDGTVNAAAGEECDDGNTQSGDGCNATCHSEEGAVPTVSGWGMIILGLLLLTGIKVGFGRRPRAPV